NDGDAAGLGFGRRSDQPDLRGLRILNAAIPQRIVLIRVICRVLLKQELFVCKFDCQLFELRLDRLKFERAKEHVPWRERRVRNGVDTTAEFQLAERKCEEPKPVV